MKVIPAIDIKNGKCIRLFQGDYAKEIIYEDDPVLMAKKWEGQGAMMLHVVDLDGAKNGKPVNFEIVKRIITETRLPVQIGGGIRDIFSMYRYIEIGVKKIILGTAALEKADFLKKAVNKYGEKIIVSLDAKNGILMKNGWVEQSNKKLLPTLQELENYGVNSIIYTDTIKDGTLTGPNYEVIKLIKEKTKMNLIVAGGISTIGQIRELKKVNVDGVIIGKALYEGAINLKEVITYVS